MTRQQLHDWKSTMEIEIEHLRAGLALPADYFAPCGAQHWHQVQSHSEIEAQLATDLQVIDYINARLST